MRFLKILVLAIAFLALVPAAYASKPSTSTGSFTTSATLVSMRTAGKNTITNDNVSITLTGMLAGTCVGTEHVVTLSNGHATIHGSCTFTGSVGTKSGTDVSTFQAVGQGTSFHGVFTVERGSGGLAGIHGVGTFKGQATGATTTAGTYSVNLHFDPS